MFHFLLIFSLTISGVAGATERLDGAILKVGVHQPVKTLAEASKVAVNGMTIEVDAGDYLKDVAVWTQSDLKFRAVGGRVRLIASGAHVEGKGVWVLRGGAVSVEGFDFIGARVPDRNGAGIRLEKGSLTVTDCSFMDNENGILTANNPEIVLEITHSEFGHNGAGDGQSHNLYVGSIKQLIVTGSHFHHAKVGHLLKSRAAENHIRHNRLVDGEGGNASYELEFPAGGIAYVVGNVIEQAPGTGNPHLIAFGAEGYKWPKNELYLVNNTLVDRRASEGVFLRVTPGAEVIVGVNNLLLGRGKLDSAGPGDYWSNFNVDSSDFAMAAPEPYRLRSGSRLVGKMTDPGAVNGFNLSPGFEFASPRGINPVSSNSRQPGAIQTLGGR
jgi:hypothetical protein